MAFTFQINDNVKFNHDKYLLDKAEKFKHPLKYKKVCPKNLVQINSDDQSFNGFKAVILDQRIEDLKNILLSKGDRITLDFGDHCVGKFSINLKSVGSPMDAPLFLHLKFGETPAEIGIDSGTYDGWLSNSWISEEFIHLDMLPTKLSLPRRYAFRYVEIEVLGASPKWQLSVSDPIALTQSAVLIDDVPKLNIKDPRLKKIDEVSIKTLHECMQDVFEDGPKRDRRLWLGDLRLQSLANYETFKDNDMVKRCLYLFAGTATVDGKIAANIFTKPSIQPDDTFLFDYSLFFISVLYDFYQQTGDKQVLDDLYPVAKKQIDLALKSVDKNGLLQLDDDWPVFIDWSNDFDKSTASQAVLIYVLKQFVILTKIMDETNTCQYQKLVDLCSKASLEKLYDSNLGMFISGPNREINLASQVWMEIAHVLNKDENRKLMTQTMVKLFPIKGIATPYMYHHIVLALIESDHKQEAIQLIKNYWGKMLDLGADTFFEAFDPDNVEFSPYGSPIVNSYCHAWSCTPTFLIRKYLLK